MLDKYEREHLRSWKQGLRCLLCNKVLTREEFLPKRDHSEGGRVRGCTEDGFYHDDCVGRYVFPNPNPPSITLTW